MDIKYIGEDRDLIFEWDYMTVCLETTKVDQVMRKGNELIN